MWLRTGPFFMTAENEDQAYQNLAEIILPEEKKNTLATGLKSKPELVFAN